MAIKIDEQAFNESLRDVLKTLKEIEPSLEREGRKSLRKAGDVVVNHAKGLVPGGPPTGVQRNTNRANWQTWSGTRDWSRSGVQRGIKVKTSTRPNKGGELRLVTLVQTNPAGVIFDMAGRSGAYVKGRQGAAFVRALTKYHGGASRVMWPAYEDKAGMVDAAMVNAVNAMVDEINGRLGGFGSRLAGI